MISIIFFDVFPIAAIYMVKKENNIFILKGTINKMVELKEHNKRPYNELVKALKEYHQAIYVSGVGTGKSFVFMKLLADSDMFKNEKCLYIVPQESISTNIMTYKEFELIKDRVTFINMQQFNSETKARELVKGYGLVVEDEVHHAASDVYGKNIVTAVTELDIPFLGLTATPVRMDKIDIRNEFAVVVNGISNFDAIQLGLMPQFTYRIGTLDKDLKSLRKRINEEKKKKSSRQVPVTMCREVIKDIAETYPRKKYIAFSGSISQLRKDKLTVKYAFPDKDIYEMHTESSNVKNVLNDFNHADSGILMTVDMALEGIHLDNVDGIILFRNVQSIPVFEQILGRVCSIGKKISPVVIDCSGRGIILLRKLIAYNNARWKNVTPKKKKELNDLYQEIHKNKNENETEQTDDHKSIKVEINSKPDKPVAALDSNNVPETNIESVTDFAIKRSNIEIDSDVNKNNNDNGESESFTPRDILHIALGSHEEWKDVAEFEKAWADSDPSEHEQTRELRVQQAIDMWNRCKSAYDAVPSGVAKKCMTAIASKCGTTVSEMQKLL